MRLCALLLVQITLLCFLFSSTNGHGLKVGFYDDSCPKVEAIVRNTLLYYFSQDKTITAPLLRLHFHDCFVGGCDGSVLLNSTKTNKAEKDAKPNLSLDGFYVIDAAKAVVEKACPGVVSCADIVALAARDAVSLAAVYTGRGRKVTYNKLYEAETGRRDGVVSKASEALANLPSSMADFAALRKNFSSKGLSVKDMAVLSGAHAIGSSHCNSFDKRLQNYKGSKRIDPTIDPYYAMKLRKECKLDNQTEVAMVPGSSTTFDTKYYQLVIKKKGLFHSDAALLQNKVTRHYVYSRAKLHKSIFFTDFAASMIKMGKVQVLTGHEGQIRKHCALVNY